MFRSLLPALVVTIATAALAFAADDHHHKGQHGGMMVDTSGHHHVELVANDHSIELHVLHDDGESEDITNAKATATVLSGGKTKKIPLIPDGDALKGSGQTKLGKGDTIVITLTMPGHEPEQARFKLE